MNFIDESLAIMLILEWNYNGFLQDMFRPEVAMLESPYKNNGFVNFIDGSLAIRLILARNYIGFLVDMFCPEVAMLESPYKNNGFVNSIFFPIQI